MTYTIANPHKKNWSALFGLQDLNIKTPLERSRQVKLSNLSEESQSTKHNGVKSVGFSSAELEKMAKAELLHNRRKASENNSMSVHTRFLALRRHHNNDDVRQRMLNILITTLGESQSIKLMEDLTNELIVNSELDKKRSKSLIARDLADHHVNSEIQIISKQTYFLNDNGGFDITRDRIEKLADDEEEDEYGRVIKPTEYATKKAIDLISEAIKLCCNNFSKAWASTEDSGGIYLTWSKPDSEKELRVLVPAKKELDVYLYHEEKEKYDSENNVSAKDLSKWIDWINS
jgi:hypothetical protein